MVLSILNLAALIALWIAENYIGERLHITTVLAYMPQHPFGIPAALLLLWSLAARRRSLILLNAAALAFFAIALMGFQVNLRGSGDFAVTTYNIHHGSGGIEAVARAILAERPDVVCLQETNGFPISELQRRFPGWHIVNVQETAILAKRPFTCRAYAMPDTGRVALAADFGEITVLNVHVMPGSIRARRGTRVEQVRRIGEILDALPGPVVLTGDFNTPPRGRLYRRLARRMDDAWTRGGLGFGYTYRSDLPVLRIDHIFVSGARVVSCRVARSGASDHRPVTAVLETRR
ncbi:MAG: endonuclease/exonuclease/phosphatase family protein [Armatimonadota bacterium]